MNNNFLDPDDETGKYDTFDIENHKIFAAIGYVPVLFIVPLLAAYGSPYARFHANQGLILTVITAVLAVAKSILCWIFGNIIFLRLFIPDIISSAVYIAIIAMMITGIINAAQGRARRLPIIGGMLNII